MIRSRTRLLTEMSLSVALAAVLNAMPVWRMPQGGSVSLGMLPIIVLALRRGPAAGVLAGTVYGAVDFFVNPYPPLHWLQVVLDYPLAYALVGLAGLWAAAWAAADGGSRSAMWRALVPATVVASLARYAAHVASGIVFFGSFAPAGQPVALYSALYNSYVLVSAVACGAAAGVVLPALERVVPVRPRGAS